MSPRRLLAAPYPFKGTLSGTDAAAAIADGVARFDPAIATQTLPLGDGGGGTLDALLHGLGGDHRLDRCTGAAGEPRECRWGMADERTAVIEAAQVIALADVPPELRDPSRLSTIGLGELLLHALRFDPGRVVIGLGDTATHDCGIGAGSALGYRFLDHAGRELPPIGHSLPDLAAIDSSKAITLRGMPPVTIFCDVLNPLLGPDGAALRFASQKGADPASVELLERGSRRFAEVVLRDLGVDVAMIPGGGAAGGLGAGLAACAGGTLSGGATGVLDAVRFDAVAGGCDLVITGEGRLDGKTLLGKGVGVVAERARRMNLPVMIVAGGVEGEPREWERRLGAVIVTLAEEPEDLPHAARLSSAVLRALRRMAGRG